MLNPTDRQNVVLAALDEFERPLLRYATRLLGGDEDIARDAVQHAFLKLCERADLDESTNVAAWLYTVCRNRAMDRWRQLKREPIAEEDASNGLADEQFGPVASLERADLLRLIQRLIGKLANSEREVAELWSQGFSHREICEVTGKSAGTVRVCLHRAIKSIQSHAAIKEWSGESGLVNGRK